MASPHTIRSVTAQAARDAGYLSLGLLTSVLALCVWTTGLSLSLSLVVLIVGLPVIVGSAIVFRWTAELDRRNAAWFLRRPVRAGYRAPGRGLRGLLGSTLGDGQTWRDLVWLVLHSVVGFAFGCVALGLIALTAGVATLPAWYWSLPQGADVGIGNADSLGEAFALALLAVPAAVLTLFALRGMAIAESVLAESLLGGDDGSVQAAATSAAPRSDASPSDASRSDAPRSDASPSDVSRSDASRSDATRSDAPRSDASRSDAPRAASPRARRFDPHVAFAMHFALTALVAVVMTVIWAGSGFGYFWPAWVVTAVAVPLALHFVFHRAQSVPATPARGVHVHKNVVLIVVGYLTCVWALAGGGTFWPFWPALGLSIPLAIHALVVYRDRLNPARERELTERVDELTRTRRGALDVQAAELRRIERDLHDGAQARLVSLSMLVGRAEEQLADRPEVAALVRRAREEAGAAIGELRDLARGIAPPVLADRGLGAAVQALGVRAPMPVTVVVPDERRPPPVVETAAYFVVAEALTNVAKHAGGAAARVVVQLDSEQLVVEVTDEGPGGANPHGGGLTGLRHRVEAIDGTLTVHSPAGGPTTIRAQLPCDS